MANSHLVLRDLSLETLTLIARESFASILAISLYFIVSMTLIDIDPLYRYVLIFLFIRMMQVVFADRLSPMVCALLAISDDVLTFLYPGLSTAVIMFYLYVVRSLFTRNVQSTVPEVVLIVPYAILAYSLCWSLDYMLSALIHTTKIHMVV